MRSLLIVLAFIFTTIFVLAFDRWGQQFFVESIFAVISPSTVFLKVSPTSVGSNKSSLDFPDHFIFGISTSAYQIEGAWNVDGKSASTWDTLTHQHPELITDGTNGDIATDSYHLFNDDLDAVNFAGVRIFE